MNLAQNIRLTLFNFFSGREVGVAKLFHKKHHGIKEWPSVKQARLQTRNKMRHCFNATVSALLQRHHIGTATTPPYRHCCTQQAEVFCSRRKVAKIIGLFYVWNLSNQSCSQLDMDSSSTKNARNCSTVSTALTSQPPAVVRSVV